MMQQATTQTGASESTTAAKAGADKAAPPPAATPAAAAAEAARRARLVVSSSLEPIRKDKFGFDEARHLLWRAGFGGTPAQIQLLASWGPDKAVDHLINYDKVKSDDAGGGSGEFRQDLMLPLTAEQRVEQRRAQQARDEDTLAKFRLMRQEQEQNDREQVRKMQQWWLARMIGTARPLEERMTLFWHGHFATSYRTIENSWHMMMQNQFFRRNATGNFADLLAGIIRDPAMLKYLNNDTSRKGKPNENLAREIMELFSLGVGSYSEQDIKEGARALTGYTFEGNQFDFQRNNHDGGAKFILGRRGDFDGDGFVRVILDQPACSRYIATKLYRYFVADYPTGRKAVDDAAKSVIGGLADTLQRNQYELKPVLKRLFLAQHFYDKAVRLEQIKSPVQLVVGAVRSLNTPARDLNLLTTAMRAMGQDIMFPPSVKGWDGGRAWINSATMFIRQNALVFLLTGRHPRGRDALADKEKFDPAKLLGQLADAYPGAATTGGTSQRTLEAILAFAIGRSDPAGRDVLERFVESRGKLDDAAMTELMLLVTSMPEYQLC